MEKNIKIVRTDMELECPFIDEKLREKGYELVLLPDNIDDETLRNETKDADLILMCYRKISADVIKNAQKLKGIVKYGVGIDAIDIKAAIENQVCVVNIPEYAEETVAEGAFSLILSLAKKLIPLNKAVQAEGWAWPAQNWLSHDLAEKTVGLIGTGKIGSSLARMAGAGFRANILGYDPSVDAQTMKAHGITKVNDLKEMLAQCDFVSVHAVLNDSSYHLMGVEEFSAMKETAYFINVARGAIVDEVALLDAIKKGTIAGAGLDVYSVEPLSKKDHPLSELFDRDNVILFPHLTFYTQEAMKRLEIETLDRCFEILNGEPVLIKSKDPRLLVQKTGVKFE